MIQYLYIWQNDHIPKFSEHVTIHSYDFFLMMKNFQIYSLSNFQIFTIVLLSIVTMLYIASS